MEGCSVTVGRRISVKAERLFQVGSVPKHPPKGYTVPHSTRMHYFWREKQTDGGSRVHVRRGNVTHQLWEFCLNE